MPKRRLCPKCESIEVVRLPKNSISPHPGYGCKDCGLLMRPNSMGIVFGVILLLSLGIAALAVGSWFGLDGDGGQLSLWSIELAIVGGVVAVYSAYQLCRPAPKLVDDDNS